VAYRNFGLLSRIINVGRTAPTASHVMIVADRNPQLPRKLLVAFLVATLPEEASLAARAFGRESRLVRRCYVDKSGNVPGGSPDRCSW
jgi:hypothetical protein